MPLDISLSGWNPFSKSISLHADGYYFYLYPLFVELAKQTGKMIDLYAESEFKTDSLPALKATLAKAKHLVDAQPEDWDVKTGWTDESKTVPMLDRVNKDRFVHLLDDWTNMVNTAITKGQTIRCVGD